MSSIKNLAERSNLDANYLWISRTNLVATEWSLQMKWDAINWVIIMKF